MQLAINRWHVVLKGTRKAVNYYGFKTKKEAEEFARRYTEVFGVEHEVLDRKK